MWKRFLAGGAVFALLLGGLAQAARDVTKPGDTIVAVPNDGDWPGNEAVNQAIDDQIVTKYLHFKGDTQPVGLRVTPSVGPTVVTAVRFCSANDTLTYPGRAPARYELSGSNDSIDGPYTLIASGDIRDFGGGTYTWPERTWTTTPMTFPNTVAYKHYELILRGRGLLAMSTNSDSVQIAEIELLMDVFKATGANPVDGAIGVAQPLMQWVAGDGAVFHNVYFGTSPDLTAANLVASRIAWTMYWHVPGLEPGATYYWRVDEITLAGKVTQGDVWTFMAAPLTAYAPMPRDGEKWVNVNTSLSWQAGRNAMSHEVYFGTDRAAVEARDASVFKGKVPTLTMSVGPLQENTTYYWAVDELNGEKRAGAVWRFTTVGGGGGVKGEYYNNTTLGGAPILVRVDPEININTDASPGPGVNADGWSARWTADLEIAIADTFYFSINCQDGTRMWIDGELIIDKWVTPTVTSEYFSLPVYLESGIHSLRVEYFDAGGQAVEQLSWWTATMAKVIIPAGPLQPPLRARALYPPDGAVDVPQGVTLTWSAGEKVASHDVYFGDDEAAVAAATRADTAIYRGSQPRDKTSLVLAGLEWNKTYYWRVDEVNDAEADSPWKADVWSFTTADFLVVDDFDSYSNDVVGRIFQTWIDGWGFTEPPPGNPGNGTGSTVGYIDPPFAETTIVHGGLQSMPLDYNNINSPYYSETERTWTTAQNWTVNGVDTLSLWIRGYPAPQTVTETTPGKFTITGEGADIWNNADEFTFVYKTLNGDGSLVARVVSNGTGSNRWAKGGVMIRDSLAAGSTHTMMVMTGGDGNGASLQWRATTDGASSNSDATAAVAPPYWVKIERVGSSLTGSISPNGTTWTQLGTSQVIFMDAPVYIGLCVTSHVAGVNRTYEFDNVKATGSVTGQWQTLEIGLTRNARASLYVVLQDSSNNTRGVSHPDAGAVNFTQWTEWKIPLSQFTGVSASRIKKMYIGVGDRNNPAPDGHGMLYIDDIRVVKPAAAP